jgi:hypothetical protein
MLMMERDYRLNTRMKILEAHQEENGWGLPDVSDGYLLGVLQGHLK